MPDKSRRGKGRHPPRSKRKKIARGSIAAQQLPVSQTYESVPQSEVSARATSVPTPSATVTTVRYPYITTELRRIGILAGIMLVVLVVLSLVFS